MNEEYGQRAFYMAQESQDSIAYLTRRIQEMQATIDDLQARIEELEQ